MASVLQVDDINLGNDPSGIPPPSYTSAVLGRSLRRLDTKTFFPQCLSGAVPLKQAQFETFDHVVHRANNWLQATPLFEVWKCETIEQRVGSLIEFYQNHTMQYMNAQATNGVIYIYGVRLWCSERESGPTSNPQQLSFMDLAPQCHTPGERFPVFDSVVTCVQKLNARLQQTTLEGNILTIETVQYKIPQDEYHAIRDTNKPYTKRTFWRDTYDTYLLSFIRLFYVSGPPMYSQVTRSTMTISVQDFLPDCTQPDSLFFNYHYAPFSNVLNKAKTWINGNRALKVNNMQTLEAVEHNGGVDTTHMMNKKVEEKTRVRHIRLFLLCPSPEVDPLPLNLTYKTFLPMVIRRVGAFDIDEYRENLGNYLKWVRAWLQSSGATVYSAETIHMTEQSSETPLDEKSKEKGEWYYKKTTIRDHNGHTHTHKRGPHRSKTIYAIRVYFNGPYREPPASALPPRPRVNDDECCAII